MLKAISFSLLIALILGLDITHEDITKYSKKNVACTKALKVEVLSNRNSKSQKVFQLNKNTTVEIEKQKLGWAKVTHNNNSGWIKSYNLGPLNKKCLSGKNLYSIAQVSSN